MSASPETHITGSQLAALLLLAALLVAVGRTSAEQTLGDYTHHRTLPNGVEVFAGESGLRLRWYR